MEIIEASLGPLDRTFADLEIQGVIAQKFGAEWHVTIAVGSPDRFSVRAGTGDTLGAGIIDAFSMESKVKS